MSIDELEQRKRELEQDLLQSIASRIVKFRSDTGYAPVEVGIEMLNCSLIGAKAPTAVVTGVSVRLGIEL